MTKLPKGRTTACRECTASRQTRENLKNHRNLRRTFQSGRRTRESGSESERRQSTSTARATPKSRTRTKTTATRPPPLRRRRPPEAATATPLFRRVRPPWRLPRRCHARRCLRRRKLGGQKHQTNLSLSLLVRVRAEVVILRLHHRRNQEEELPRKVPGVRVLHENAQVRASLPPTHPNTPPSTAPTCLTTHLLHLLLLLPLRPISTACVCSRDTS